MLLHICIWMNCYFVSRKFRIMLLVFSFQKYRLNSVQYNPMFFDNFVLQCVILQQIWIVGIISHQNNYFLWNQAIRTSQLEFCYQSTLLASETKINVFFNLHTSETFVQSRLQFSQLWDLRKGLLMPWLLTKDLFEQQMSRSFIR